MEKKQNFNKIQALPSFFLSKLFKAALTDIKSIGQMQNYLERLKSWITSPKGIIISVSSIALITATRLYFRGGVCKADRDLTGKIVVITGGNTGIGKATVEELAKRNCTIIFGARDERKSEEAIKDILSRNKQAKIMQFKLDLSDKDSIKEFSLKVKEQCQRIDILINNAAVMALPQREITANGFEMQMGVNHFGHFYLTYLLWDRIRNTEKARIINVSSKAHMGFGYPKSNLVIDFNDINFRNGYNPGVSYGRSKAANILFTKELQRRIDESGLDITTYCLHPGVVRTELSRYMGWKIIFAKVFLAPFAYLMMKNPLQGAQTTLYTALEDESKLTKAAYYADCQVAPNTEFTSSVENGQHLWMLTEQQLGIEFNV